MQRNMSQKDTHTFGGATGHSIPLGECWASTPTSHIHSLSGMDKVRLEKNFDAACGDAQIITV